MIVLVAGIVLCGSLTCVQLRLAHQLGLRASPRPDRWHHATTPTGGGVAIFAALAMLYGIFLRNVPLCIVLGVTGIWVLGIVDDVFQLSPRVKLLGQLSISLAMVTSGFTYRGTAWGFVNVGFTVVWLVGITNAFNLIDNMDGLCAGVTVVISGFQFVALGYAGNWSEAYAMLGIAGVYGGFLLFNLSPAQMFMGDCGSMLAGFALASLTLDASSAGPVPPSRGFVYLLLTFLYPIFDMALVSVLRRSAGRPISVGGRDHSSHRLSSLGLTDRQVVPVLWLLTTFGCGAAMLVHRSWVGVITMGTVVTISVAALGVFLAHLPGSTVPRDGRITM